MLEEEIRLDEIIFVLVLYRVKLLESKTFNSLLNTRFNNNQKLNLIIYDNSPENQIIPTVENVNIINYVHDKTNPGVSKAYNWGVMRADKLNLNWVVLLDQDSAMPADFIEKMILAISRNCQIKLFAPFLRLKDGTPFSPTRYKYKRGYSVKLTPGVLPLEKYSPVNSGMTINIKAFLNAGGYNEDVTLDFSDFQFIERFRQKYNEFYLFDSIIIQDFSNDEDDLNKLRNRFEIYCKCAKKCSHRSLSDRLGYLYAVSRHTVGLVLKTKKRFFFKIAYLNYFK